GGLLAEAMGGDFRAGAIAGGANEVLVGLLGDKLLPSNLVKGTPEYEQAQANLLALSQIVGVIGAAAGNSDVSVSAAVSANATQYNWLSHAEIRDADKARAACATAGGDVGACQANVTRATDELDKARDYELKERKRAIQLQSFKDGGWTLGEYNKALFDDYFASKGVDRSQVTFDGYAPAKTLGYMLSERGLGSVNQALEWPTKAAASAVNFASHPYDTVVGIGQNIWSAAGSGVDWATSPIPAQGLERAGDKLLAQSDQQAGGLIFDVVSGLITAEIGGFAVKWVGGKWVQAEGAKEIGAHAKVDYSSIENPPNVGPGKEFTLRQKQEALELNKAANDGVVKSDASGTVLVKPQKSQRGVTPDPNEWQFDHIKPKNCDGTNCSSNLQILSRQENRAKSDK
ncbi:HNH endonuclease signature motif containing protein, partial [Pseudomonas syringae]